MVVIVVKGSSKGRPAVPSAAQLADYFSSKLSSFHSGQATGIRGLPSLIASTISNQEISGTISFVITCCSQVSW